MKHEYIPLICLGVLLLIEVFFLILKFKVIDPIFKEREKKKNPDFVALNEEVHVLDEKRANIYKQLKSIESIIEKMTYIAPYMPVDYYIETKESLEPLKERYLEKLREHESLTAEVEEIYKRISKIRKERKLKYN